MPDFNFAKGSRKKHADTSEPASRPAPPLSGSADSGSPETPTSGSVLDRYPRQDYSKLTSGGRDVPETGESGGASGGAPPADPPEDGADHTVQNDAGSPADMARPPAAAAPSGGSRSNTATLIALASIVLFLVIVAFIWFVNPYPPLRSAIEGVFGSPAVPDTQTVAASTDTLPSASPATPEERVDLRSWEYFLQVSSWQSLSKAEQDAQRYRGRGRDVSIESEFLQARRATFYRVRIGPFTSKDAAAAYRDKEAGLVPAGAFIDSVRVDDVEAAEHYPAHPVAAPEREMRTDDDGGEYDVRILDEPLRGFAVKVSSFKNVGVARTEAQHLLAQGFPAFLTTTSIGGTTWYRVLVGPFSDRRDADKYTRLINVTYGNDAYTVDLARE